MTIPAALQLSELTYQIEALVKGQFEGQHYWVVAEITGHKFQPAKGFHYFDLVEKQAGTAGLKAKINAVAWTAGARQIEAFEKTTGQRFTDGLQVLIKVSVDYSAVYGLKLTLLDVDAGYTIGQLEQQKQATLQRLVTECAAYIQKVGDGYMTINKQLRLPAVLQRIAVVTAQTSAGYQDFHHTLTNNQYGYHFFVDTYFTTVQGETNAAQIKDRLLNIFTSGQPYDAVVIIRGGGSTTDFLVFDTFILGQVTAKFPIPIITGIGHQHNETIVDLMAHTPLKTPTKVAEFIIAHNKAFEDRLTTLQNRLVVKTQQLLADKQSELVTTERTLLHEAQAGLHSHRRILDSIARELITKPALLFSSQQQYLLNTSRQLQFSSYMYLEHEKANLQGMGTLLRVLNPDSILKRGFAMVSYQGKIATDASILPLGAEINVLLAKTTITATINAKQPVHEESTDL
jgi:exodeoxyribonuclease VII large subunit